MNKANTCFSICGVVDAITEDQYGKTFFVDHSNYKYESTQIPVKVGNKVTTACGPVNEGDVVWFAGEISAREWKRKYFLDLYVRNYIVLGCNKVALVESESVPADKVPDFSDMEPTPF